jgi:SAM-dependent methyltransferase
MNEENIVGDYWGEFHNKQRYKLSWLESQVVIDYINNRVTQGEESWYSILKKINNKAKFRHALIVGCGAGELERNLYQNGYFENALGVDISEKSLELAEKKAEEIGIKNIKYKLFNLESDDYKKLGKFDLIIVTMAAHHIENLHYFYKNLYDIIDKKNGIIVLNEYIGPNRFNHSDKVVNIINRLLSALDESYKKNYLVDGYPVRNMYIRTPIEHFLKHDPSEAIRSEDIVRKLQKKFRIISYRPYGGQLNHMLLTGIIENFERENKKTADSILKLLMTFEEILEDFRIIDSDFAFIISKPKPFFYSPNIILIKNKLINVLYIKWIFKLIFLLRKKIQVSR